MVRGIVPSLILKQLSHMQLQCNNLPSPFNTRSHFRILKEFLFVASIKVKRTRQPLPAIHTLSLLASRTTRVASSFRP